MSNLTAPNGMQSRTVFRSPGRLADVLIYGHNEADAVELIACANPEAESVEPTQAVVWGTVAELRRFCEWFLSTYPRKAR